MNRQINISRARFSRLAWDAILEEASCYRHLASELDEASLACEKLRFSADYNTGSISNAAMWCIAASALMFSPKIVAEVGTFIGKSTQSLAWGMSKKEGGYILTCDFSNKIALPDMFRVKIIQFEKQSSTDMFNHMAEKKIKADFLFLDGRIAPEDIKLLPQVIHENAVILLDDFEGVEKGVINAIHLMAMESEAYKKLVYPPSSELLARHGVHGPCNLGMILPNTRFGWTNQ
ncbi:MAG: hypothetical protein ACO3I1_04035 [Burkholderiales bacterium]